MMRAYMRLHSSNTLIIRGAMSDLAQRFTAAQAQIKPKTGLSNDTMLELYALYKQATSGDVSGSKPGMLDLRGRAKYEAWSKRKGTAREAAMQTYITLVESLCASGR